MLKKILSIILLSMFVFGLNAQEHGSHESPNGDESHDSHHAFDPAESAFHHISNHNVYSIGPWNIPLPCILYAPEEGWSMFMSGVFEPSAEHHGTGHKAYKKYVLDKGIVKHVADPSFPSEEVKIEDVVTREEMVDGKKKDVSYVKYNGKEYKLDSKSTMDGGVFGGGITSFYDFSITKNVAGMMLVALFLMWVFIRVARTYKEREGKAPKGIQNFLEPLFLFIQDEVTKPFLGDKWEKYNPFLMTLFFFILGLNLFGQIPFFGGSNITGNLAVTMVLAIVTFFVVNLNGNKNYWEHVLWMPGVPAWVKTILTPVEIMSMFIKPMTLMLRLFANIVAGHIVIAIFIGLIFVFGKSGQLVGASYGTSVVSMLLAMFMMSLEILVAFVQAYVFTILTASYLSAATEEAHH